MLALQSVSMETAKRAMAWHDWHIPCAMQTKQWQASTNWWVINGFVCSELWTIFCIQAFKLHLTALLLPVLNTLPPFSYFIFIFYFTALTNRVAWHTDTKVLLYQKCTTAVSREFIVHFQELKSLTDVLLYVHHPRGQKNCMRSVCADVCGPSWWWILRHTDSSTSEDKVCSGL